MDSLTTTSPDAHREALFVLLLLSLLAYLSLPLLTQFKVMDAATAILPLGAIVALMLLMQIALDWAEGTAPYAGALRSVRARAASWARASFAAGLAGTALITGAYAIIVYDKTYPLSEGWFSIFARYINAGKVPYRDFELLATPLYSYLIAGITSIFGYDLIVLRVVGLLLFVGIAVMAYLIFSRLFKPAIAMVAASLTVLFMQSEVANVFYDYTRFFDFFAYAACLSLMIYVSKCDRPGTRRFSWAVTAAGLSTSVALLIRQNSGALVAAYVVVLLVFLTVMLDDRRAALINLANYVVALVLPIAAMVALMISNGSFGAFRRMTITGALSAKGGISVTLFAWLGRAAHHVLADAGAVAVLLVLLLTNAALNARSRAGDGEDHAGLRLGALFAVPTLLGVVFCYRNLELSHVFAHLRGWQTPYSVYAAALALFVVALVRVLRAGKRDRARRTSSLLFLTLTGMVVALGYGSGTSGGLSEGQTALALGTVFATILYLGAHRFAAPAQLIALALSACLCLSFVAYKYEHPYAWWGLNEPDVRLATEAVAVDHMNGIRVSPWTKTAIEGIAAAITRNSKQGDNVFVFPHIPIFYLLTDRYPHTFTLVQWFDFSSTAGVEADIRTIERDPPRVIVIGEVPAFVTAAHQTLFRDGGAEQQMLAALESLVRSRGYQRVGTYMVDQDCRFAVYAVR